MANSNSPDGGGSGARNTFNDETPSVRHRVALPPKEGLLKEFKSVVQETFFHDAPLRDFKDQTPSKKVLLGIQAVFPIVGWARNYNFRKLRGDVIAGLTIASLCIPQDIGYAKLANLDPKYGLYSSFVPPLIYAAMGSSRDIAIGPVAVVSLLLGTLCQAVIDPVDHPAEYLRLAFTATFFAGIFEAGLGFLRLGFLIDFLSHAAVVGFMGGAAITISLQQLKGFLGIKTKKFTKKTDLVSVMRSVFTEAHHGWNWQTIVIASSFLTFLLVAKFIGKRHRKLFWVPAIAPLISVIVSTFFVFITRADKDGVQIVKHIDQGINPISAHKIYFSGKYLTDGIRIGGIAGMVALTEAVAIARTFAAMKDYQIDGNKEMIALGSMNVVGSLTSCYITTGSFSRSAVNYMAGCQTTVSNIVMSIVVALTLLFITPLFKYTPNAILAAIIISAVLGLIDIDAAVLIWKIDKLDFLACMGAFFGVVFISVEIGLLISVVISFAKILLQVTRPRTTVLGKLPGTNVYRNTLQYPEATKIPGILIIRIDSAIYFSNSNYVRERALRWLREEQEKNKEAGMPKVKFVIIEMSPVTDIDTSGIHSLEELLKSLEKQDIQLILANPGPIVTQKLHASKFADEIKEENIFLCVGDAVAVCAPKLAEQLA
ncbi:Sulfate transporter 1.1 [Cardamine amara subsp. amara]|uniref:Sulfate transporter 1.1 n=1 Tax=Cardamine amara subsp. amara TaxID=228776 RepID=A0ABD0Z0L7_CARAN